VDFTREMTLWVGFAWAATTCGLFLEQSPYAMVLEGLRCMFGAYCSAPIVAPHLPLVARNAYKTGLMGVAVWWLGVHTMSYAEKKGQKGSTKGPPNK
jgi:hypothetical protein